MTIFFKKIKILYDKTYKNISFINAHNNYNKIIKSNYYLYLKAK